MAFRSIETLARDVLAKLEMQGRGSSDERAPAPAYPVTGMGVATDTRGEVPMPVAFAQGGEVAAEQTELGKGTGANPGQVYLGGTVKPAEAERPSNVICIGNSFPGWFDTNLPVGREIATVKRRNRSKPHASAVVISLAMYRAQSHAVTQPQATAR